jgi:GTP-binding protein
MNRPNPQPFARSRFLLSAAAPAHFPPPDCVEVAFAGRSNAGKSSALNAITGHKGLARVSKTPGRTQLINFFDVGPEDGVLARLVDLPGYGFAQVPPEVKRRWAALVEAYLRGRENLQAIVLLMDARHPLTDFDRHLLDWCVAYRRPCHILLTKADKLSRGAAAQQRLAVEKALREWNLPISVQLFSALAGTGTGEIRETLARVLGLPAD